MGKGSYRRQGRQAGRTRCCRRESACLPYLLLNSKSALRIERVDLVRDVTEADVLAVDRLEFGDGRVGFAHQLEADAQLVDDVLLRLVHGAQVVLRRRELGHREIVEFLRLEAA